MCHLCHKLFLFVRERLPLIWCWTTEMKSNIDCTAFDRDSIIFAGNNIGVDKPIAIARHRTWKQFFFALISWLFECLERWKEINYLPPFTTLQVFKSNMSHKLKTLGRYLSPSIWSSKCVFFLPMLKISVSFCTNKKSNNQSTDIALHWIAR